MDGDDTEALIRFSDELDLLQSEYSDHRHIKLLRHCTRISEEVGGLADALEDENAARDALRWINATYEDIQEKLASDGQKGSRKRRIASTRLDDVLDAMALAATASRDEGQLATLPTDPPTDGKGLPMEIVYPVES
ncbi:hypothetical protein BRD00_07865 [Halobacteriales archaeon QS_8_69_26]|nr:MAG: hypothetical protein BRD00_07865 [Halobacteriales archaeon QS_8_69_26]